MVWVNAASNETTFCTSTLPKVLGNVTLPRSQCIITPPPPPLPAGVLGFTPQLTPGTRLRDGAPGFVSLSSLTMRPDLRKASVNVLGTASKKESLILCVQVEEQLLSMLTTRPCPGQFLRAGCKCAWAALRAPGAGILCCVCSRSLNVMPRAGLIRLEVLGSGTTCHCHL